MKTKKDPFNELESKFSEISAKKTEAIDFLENRVQENSDLLQSIRPNKIHGSNIFERSSFFLIPRAEYAVKVVVTSALGLGIGTASVTFLLPGTAILLCSKEGRQVVKDVIKSFTPELKDWKIPDAELRGGGIIGSENSSSIFYRTQDTIESDHRVSINLASINALATTQSAEYRGINADNLKLTNLRSSPINKPDEIKKLESEIKIKKEQTRIKNLIAELEKYRDEEIELIKGNLKKGDTLVVNGLQQGDVGYQAQVKTQEFKRASSIESAFKRSFSFSASRKIVSDDRKLKRTQSFSSLKEVDGSPTQSLFFSSKNRSREEVQGIQDAISRIDDGYSKQITKLMQASRDLSIQSASLEKNIKEYNDNIQKEENIKELKALLDSDQLDRKLIEEKFNEIIGRAPAPNPTNNSHDTSIWKLTLAPQKSETIKNNPQVIDLFDQLSNEQELKLRGIINPPNTVISPSTSLGSSRSLIALNRIESSKS